MTNLNAEDFTILIVEDVYMVRRTLELILKSRGFQVVDAPNANAAITLIKAGQRPDLIMLDIMMPGIDGVKFAGMLKAYEHTRSVPIVMCSARGDASTVTKSYIQGVSGFIVKPFTRDTVLNKVCSILGLPAAKPAPAPKKKAPPKKAKPKKAQTKKRTKGKTTKRPFAKTRKTKRRTKKKR